MEEAFVIGNGISRLDIDLEKIDGKTYGCNLLYETFQPDVLVAVDAKVANRIQNLDYCKTHILYTREPKSDSGAIKIEKNWGYSSGPVAITLACQDNPRYVYMIGFDLKGTAQGKLNNVYADRENYKTSDMDETHYGNWIQQVQQIMKDYPQIKFIRVNPHLDYSPREWTESRNYTTMSLKHFLQKINI